MKIFVLGAHSSGLSPFAKMISEKLGFSQVVSASEWINTLYPESSLKLKQERLNTLTDLTLHELRKNPNSCVDYIKKHYDLTKPIIIEGITNPSDFIHMFNPTKDITVFLNRSDNPNKTNNFELGLLVIDHFINWNATINLLETERRVNFQFSIKELPEVVDNFVKLYQYKSWCKTCDGAFCNCLK